LGANKLLFIQIYLLIMINIWLNLSCSLIITIMSMKDGILNVGKLWMLVGEKMGNSLGRVLEYKYDWSFLDYLYTPRETLEHDVWNCFIDKFKALLEYIYISW